MEHRFKDEFYWVVFTGNTVETCTDGELTGEDFVLEGPLRSFKAAKWLAGQGNCVIQLVLNLRDMLKSGVL